MTRAFDIMRDACPTRQVLGRIADKWTMLVVLALGDGTLRFSQLRSRIQGAHADSARVGTRRDGIQAGVPHRPCDCGIHADTTRKQPRRSGLCNPRLGLYPYERNRRSTPSLRYDGGTALNRCRVSFKIRYFWSAWLR
jgi:hypothetical protein